MFGNKERTLVTVFYQLVKANQMVSFSCGTDWLYIVHKCPHVRPLLCLIDKVGEKVEESPESFPFSEQRIRKHAAIGDHCHKKLARAGGEGCVSLCVCVRSVNC